ncbi:guanine nucleotide-binding protein G(I)/G(S)/G(O) subunit gamma-12 [Polypterus senegalus]
MSSNNAASNLVAMRKTVQQLRQEANIRRIKVSQASSELMKFCEVNAHKDPLLMRIPTSDNPFRPPKSCCVL